MQKAPLLTRIKRGVLWRLAAGRVGRFIRDTVWLHPFVHGPTSRLHVTDGVDLVNTYINTHSGDVWLGQDVSFGHNVSLIAGTHDTAQFGAERRAAIPPTGRDIIVEEGVWIASNAIVIGACRLGAHAVIAAGAVVTRDVPPYAIVAGIPAKVIAQISPERA